MVCFKGNTPPCRVSPAILTIQTLSAFGNCSVYFIDFLLLSTTMEYNFKVPFVFKTSFFQRFCFNLNYAIILYSFNMYILICVQQEMSSLSVLPSAASPAAPSVDVHFINTTISALRANVSLINDTLSKKIQWAQEDLATHQVSHSATLLSSYLLM